MNIAAILSIKFPGSFPDKILLQDDGEGVYIREWNLESPEPTQSELEQWNVELQDEIYNNIQRELRKAAYPSLRDQFDLQYWDKENGTNLWQEAISKVKEQYPLIQGE